MSFFNTRRSCVSVLAIVVVARHCCRSMLEDDLLRILGTGFVLAIGAIGLNLVTGYAGQVSLGHAFFVGVGAYTAAVHLRRPGRALPRARDHLRRRSGSSRPELVAAICGAIVAPLATRLRGLYLAIVTLGLVFIGEYFFGEWTELSGGTNVGRDAAEPVLFGNDLTERRRVHRGAEALLALPRGPGHLRGAGPQPRAVAVGRAFAAVRDRDIAAGVMGVNLGKYKLIAFTISSFYAGRRAARCCSWPTGTSARSSSTC